MSKRLQKYLTFCKSTRKKCHEQEKCYLFETKTKKKETVVTAIFTLGAILYIFVSTDLMFL